MRRPASAVVATLALVALGAAGCSSAARSPTLPTTHFTPTAEIVIGCPPGEHCPASPTARVGLAVLKPSSTTEVGSVTSGSTVVVKNLAAGTHQVTGMIRDHQVFDTGQMKAGNTTTVVLTTPGGMVITDVTTGEHVELTVGSDQVRN